MPVQGLSLLGFMDQAQALHHLSVACVPKNSDPNVLLAEWQSAKANLGTPLTNQGHPNMQSVPVTHSAHVAQIMTNPIFRRPDYASASIMLVEIEPLLAYQFSVMTSRSAQHCGAFSSPPTTDELFNTCLPLGPVNEPIIVERTPQSIILKSKSLNVQGIQGGLLPNNVLGLNFDISLPHVHVVRHAGKCYLHNGYHRCYGAATAGATHVPCIFRDVATIEEVGALGGLGIFSEKQLAAPHAPTLANFSRGWAHTVDLREVSRVIHVSWAQYVMREE